MIIMPVKEGENIEKALKKFKRKYERTGVLKELRRRQYFTKPSIAKREAMQSFAMAANDATALKLAREDYIREEMARQRCVLEKIYARRHGHEVGGVILLDDTNEEASGPSNPPRIGYASRGCSRDGNDDDDNDDYTKFYRLLDM